jgi:steroid 5-alpha reductase family enzyme
MNMKRQMLIYFFISMLVDREKEWDNYKMEVVIKKVNKKKIVIFQIIFEMVHGQPYEGFKKKKTPIYQFPWLVTGIWNVSPFKRPLIA